MNNTKDDGGAAFPHKEYETAIDHGNGGYEYHDASPGMSLRDYFAAAALPAILQNKDYYNRKACKHEIKKGNLTSWGECNTLTDVEALAHDAEMCAIASYAIADAMLQARKES